MIISLKNGQHVDFMFPAIRSRKHFIFHIFFTHSTKYSAHIYMYAPSDAINHYKL